MKYYIHHTIFFNFLSITVVIVKCPRKAEKEGWGSILPIPPLEHKCQGALEITHEDDERNISDIFLDSEIQKKYLNLRIKFPVLQINSVSVLTLKGDCCWEIYEKSKFRGQKKIMFPGVNKYIPDFQLVSVKATECTIIDK